MDRTRNLAIHSGKELYLVLKEMYYEIDDFAAAEEVTRIIVRLFD